MKLTPYDAQTLVTMLAIAICAKQGRSADLADPDGGAGDQDILDLAECLVDPFKSEAIDLLTRLLRLNDRYYYSTEEQP